MVHKSQNILVSRQRHRERDAQTILLQLHFQCVWEKNQVSLCNELNAINNSWSGNLLKDLGLETYCVVCWHKDLPSHLPSPTPHQNIYTYLLNQTHVLHGHGQRKLAKCVVMYPNIMMHYARSTISEFIVFCIKPFLTSNEDWCRCCWLVGIKWLMASNGNGMYPLSGLFESVGFWVIGQKSTPFPPKRLRLLNNSFLAQCFCSSNSICGSYHIKAQAKAKKHTRTHTEREKFFNVSGEDKSF